jgi:uncharacterized membrane protein
VTSSLSTAESRRRTTDWALVAAWILAGVCAAFYGYLSLARHWTFNSHAFDLGLQHHVVWNTFRGQFFRYTYMVGLKPHLTHYLGDHVQLILLPISWLYWIYDGPETLLIVQALVVSSGVVPLFLLGRLWLKFDLLALLMPTLFILHPSIQAAVLFDFHPLVLASAFLLWAFYLAEAHRYVGAAIAVVLALLCKENVSLVVALLGVYWLLRNRVGLGVAAIAAGIAWFFLCTSIIFPAYNAGAGANSLARYSYLGRSWFEVGWRLVTNPRLLVSRLTEPLSLHYMIGLWAPFGFLSLLSPVTMLVAASEFALSILSNFPPQRTIDYHYPVLIVAVSAVAAVHGISYVAKWLGQRTKVSRSIWAGVLVAIALLGGMRSQYHRYGTLRLFGARYAGIFTRTAHTDLGRRFLDQIPPAAAVSAQSNLAPHVSERAKVYVFPTVLDADYVFLNATSVIFPVHLFPIEGLSPEDAYVEYIRRLFEHEGFVVADAEDGWALLVRAEKPHKISAEEAERFLSNMSEMIPRP